MKLILIAAALAASTTAFCGGDKEGNGGGAIVCTGAKGRIESVKLLDLHEEEQCGFTVVRSAAPMKDQLEKALQKYSGCDFDMVEKMRKVLAHLEEKDAVAYVSASLRLAPPSDTNLQYFSAPRGCSLEGAANYDDAGDELVLDPVLYASMGPTDQAALYFHEALYRVQRMDSSDVQDSAKARAITGKVFSNVEWCMRASF